MFRTVLARWLLTIAVAQLANGCGGGASQSGCTNPPNLTSAAPVCNSVVNAAQAVAFTARTGSPPAPAGGPIADGVYVATAAEGYGAAPPGGRRITIVVLGGATQILWNGEVLDATGATVTLAFAANTHTSVSGNQINFTVDCSSTTPPPIPAALMYSATPGQLILSLASGANTSVTTYTRTGCP